MGTIYPGGNIIVVNISNFREGRVSCSDSLAGLLIGFPARILRPGIDGFSMDSDLSFCTAQEKELALRVSLISIVINVALSVFKLIAGLFSHSGAMVSDSVHSASDVFSTVIVIIGVCLSRKKSDQEHPYGHERLECVASMILAILLLVTGVMMGLEGIGKIWEVSFHGLPAEQTPGRLALGAAVISVGIKEWMFLFTRSAARRIRSNALLADAWHHRSDALSSVGAFAGILGARMGYPVLDSVAGVVICLFILKVSCDIFMTAVKQMVDVSCDQDTIDKMREEVREIPGVLGIDELRTRIFGSRVYVDIEIRADGRLSLQEAHRIAERVHLGVENAFPLVKHCMVHVNPEKIRESDGE